VAGPLATVSTPPAPTTPLTQSLRPLANAGQLTVSFADLVGFTTFLKT